MSSNVQRELSGDEGAVDDGALRALIPFSGALSPEAVRARMVSPALNGPSGAVWRRTPITQANADGAFCLYACERTGEAMWIPTGDFFVADRSQGPPNGSIMDFLVPQRRSDGRLVGRSHDSYGFTSHTSLPHGRREVHRPGPIRTRPSFLATRPSNRHNPVARPEPRPAGTGSRRTVARRERRDRASAAHQQAEGTPPTSTTTMPPPTSTTTLTPPPEITERAETTPMIIYNSDPTISGVETLNLSDEEGGNQ